MSWMRKNNRFFCVYYGRVSQALVVPFICFLVCEQIFAASRPVSSAGPVTVRRPVSARPIGPSNAPPSAVRSGLYRSPNPIDRSANLIVTGNIGGGRHFRGIVPYNAISDFAGALGSGTLDPFLRRSQDFGAYRGRLTPFYSQTGTVTSFRPGAARVFVRPVSAVGAGSDTRLIRAYNPYAVRLPPVADDSGLIKVSPGGLIPKGNLPRQDVRLRPMGMTRQELEQMVTTGLYRPRLTKEQAAKREQKYQQQLEKFQKDLKAISDRASLLRSRLEGKTEPFESERFGSQQAGLLPFDVELLKKKVEKDKKVGVYEQMQADIDRLAAALKTQTKPARQVQQQGKTGKDIAAEGEKVQTKPVRTGKLSEVMLASARAKGILGKHKSFASYSDDKFNGYMRAAAEHLKAGRFYRAADFYTLAIMSKADDPLGYAGKSNALFAAGEYVSSALFLKRAIEMFPEYVYFKIDIESMLGSRDRLDARIVDLRQWLATSGQAPELAFLLAYIYYQLDLAEPAKEHIDIAYKGMAEEPAVLVLKRAIEQLVAQQIK